MKEETDDKTPQNEEKEIDLLELAYKLWSQKKLLLIWCMWGAIAGLIIAFSIPKEYTVEVKLAPETKSNKTTISGSLGTLASMAGLSSSLGSGVDAVYPQLYPDIVESVPFATSLFDVPVEDSEGNNFILKDYLLHELRSPWWSYVMGAPRMAIGALRSLFSPQEESDSVHVTDNFQLTQEEDALVGILRSRITANVDQKTNLISIETQMQDPKVSAIVADTVVKRLQDYVTDYRTNKARKDLEFAETLNDEAQQKYYEAQQRLAEYLDKNQNLATKSAQVIRDRLDNESELAFNVFNQTSIQVQNAKSKVQETTPVYTEITPSTVPIRPTSPRKGLIIAGCIFLAFVACAAWILFGTPLVAEYKSKVKEYKDNGSTADASSTDNSDSESAEEKGHEIKEEEEK